MDWLNLLAALASGLGGAYLGARATRAATLLSLRHASEEAERQRVRDREIQAVERFYLAARAMAEYYDAYSHSRPSVNPSDALFEASYQLALWLPDSPALERAHAITAFLFQVAEDYAGEPSVRDNEKIAEDIWKLVEAYGVEARKNLRDPEGWSPVRTLHIG